jgi:drug/metabolite transporter (DMT)-like permease
MDKNRTFAHGAALVTIIIWGTTFIATKILLSTFTPIEILLIRFVMGYIGLTLLDFLLHRKNQKVKPAVRQELLFAGAGLTGVVMYYLLENIALTMTYASNVGILVSVAPLTTALLAPLFMKEEPVRVRLIFGFIIASFGVALVMFNGSINVRLSLRGDLLALSSTLGWGIYSILLKKIDTSRYSVLTYTKKIFLYGILFMTPFALRSKLSFSLSDFSLLHTALLTFLGLGASAACFVSWNHAVRVLGVFKTSAYIYLTPLVSLFTAAMVLQEPVTVMAVSGCLLILIGLYLSEKKSSSGIRISSVTTETAP